MTITTAIEEKKKVEEDMSSGGQGKPRAEVSETTETNDDEKNGGKSVVEAKPTNRREDGVAQNEDDPQSESAVDSAKSEMPNAAVAVPRSVTAGPSDTDTAGVFPADTSTGTNKQATGCGGVAAAAEEEESSSAVSSSSNPEEARRSSGARPGGIGIDVVRFAGAPEQGGNDRRRGRGRRSGRRLWSRPASRPGAVHVPGPGGGTGTSVGGRRVSRRGSGSGSGSVSGGSDGSGGDGELVDNAATIEGYVVPAAASSPPRTPRQSSAGSGPTGSVAVAVGGDLPPLVHGVSVRPGPRESTKEDSKRQQKRDRKKTLLLLVGAATLLAAVVAIVAGVVAGRSKNQPAGTSTSTLLEDEDDCWNSTAPARSDRYTQIRSAILSSIEDGALRRRVAQSLCDDSSPQSSALLWLADEDGLQVDPTNALQQAVQRFVLAVTYYSAGGDGWINGAKFLTDVGECDWWETEADPAAIEELYLVGVQCAEDNSTVASLNLGNNNLVGSLPEELALLPKLTYLSFSANFLEGTIPRGLSKDLEYLTLDTSGLSGPIPDDIWNLSALKELWMHDNKLTGTISTAIGQLSNLEGVSFDNNEFSGSIPTGLGSLESLWIISLSGNSLTGSVPTELGRLSSLQYLYLDKNCFTGLVPEGICTLKDSGILEEIVIRSPKHPLACNRLDCGCCDRQVCSTSATCIDDHFCNFDLGESGFCEECPEGPDDKAAELCGYMTLITRKGDAECEAHCFSE